MDNIDRLRTFEPEEIDFKEDRSIKFKCMQNDDLILKFRIFNYGTPVDLGTLHIEFRASKPDGEIYSETDNIELTSNEIEIKCDRQLTNVSGEVDCQFRVWNPLNYKQVSSNYIRIMVDKGVAEGDDFTASSSLISSLDHLDQSICRAVDLETEFDNAIKKAEDVMAVLEDDIKLGDECKQQLQDKIDEAETTKADLITENQICQDSLQELKDQNDIVNQTIENGKKNVQEILEAVEKSDSANDSLNAKIEESEVAKGLLQDKIDEATSKLDEFKNFDTDELVEKTNKTYNKLMPTNELITINHNLYNILKRKPIVQAISYTWGLGIGGLGEHPLGGSSSELINGLGVIHEDSNTISLKVPEDYKMDGATVEKVNDNEYCISNGTEKGITVFLI